jgi:hypothetical protein
MTDYYSQWLDLHGRSLVGRLKWALFDSLPLHRQVRERIARLTKTKPTN